MCLFFFPQHSAVQQEHEQNIIPRLLLNFSLSFHNLCSFHETQVNLQTYPARLAPAREDKRIQKMGVLNAEGNVREEIQDAQNQISILSLSSFVACI